MACSVYRSDKQEKTAREKETYSNNRKNNSGDGNHLRLPNFLNTAQVRLRSWAEYRNLEKLLNHGIAPDLGLLHSLILMVVLMVAYM